MLTIALLGLLSITEHSPAAIWGSTSPGSSYTSNPIHFQHQSVAAENSAVTGLNNSAVGVISFWLRSSPTITGGPNGPNQMGGTSLFSNLISSTSIASAGEGIPGINVTSDNNGNIRFNFADPVGSSNAPHSCLLIVSTAHTPYVYPNGFPYPGSLTNQGWHHYLVAWDFTSAANIAFYLDGVQRQTGCNTGGPYSGNFPLWVGLGSSCSYTTQSGAYTTAGGYSYSTGGGLSCSNTGSTVVTPGFALFSGNYGGANKIGSAGGDGEMADLMMDFTENACQVLGGTPGTSGSNECATSGGTTISSTILAKFIHGSRSLPPYTPANIGSTCQTPLGTTPSFCFNGVADNGGTHQGTSWYTNQGTVTFSPTTGPTNVWDGTLSPSTVFPPSNQVIWNWSQENFAGSGTSSATLNNAANPIATGDLLVAALMLLDTGASTASGNSCPGYTNSGGHCPVCPTNWNLQYDNWDNGPGGGQAKELAICTHIATSGDAVVWGTLNTSNSITWTTNVSSGWNLLFMDFSGVNSLVGTDGVEAIAGLPANKSQSTSSGTNYTASTSIVAPSITPTESSDLLLSIFQTQLSSNATLTPPSDETVLTTTVAGTGEGHMAAARYLTSNAATGNKTATYSVSHSSQAVNLAIAPVPTTCPYGSGLGDGCPGNGGQYVNTNFFSYAAQSSQTYAGAGTGSCLFPNCHPSWNLPGIDYPVGITHTLNSSNYKDPTINVPSICTYSATGWTSFSPGHPRLTCTGPGTISGYNLSAQNGHGCVQMLISPSSTGLLTFDNIYFENDSTCFNMLQPGSTVLIGTGSSPTTGPSFVLQNSTFIGHGFDSIGWSPGAGSSASFANCNSSDTACPGAGIEVFGTTTDGAQTIKYNNIQQWPGHIFGMNAHSSGSCPVSGSTQTFEYNYMDSEQMRGPEGHAAVGSMGCYDFGSYSYNTILYSNTNMAYSTTTMISASPNNSTNGAFSEDHNLLISNAFAGASADISTGNTTITIGYTAQNGILTINSVSGNGSGTPVITQGMQPNTTQVALWQNTGGGTGVGSTWTYDCTVNSASTTCPTSTTGQGYYNYYYGTSVTISGVTVQPYSTAYAGDTVHGIFQGTISYVDNYIDTTGISTPNAAGTLGQAFSTNGATCQGTPTVTATGNVNILTGGALTTDHAGSGC